jgi:hypothetical protein
MKRVKHELSYHARILSARLREGMVLRAQADATEEGVANGGLMFWLTPTGRKCGPKAARELIAKGKVSPVGDALFADQTQSWVWAGEA